MKTSAHGMDRDRMLQAALWPFCRRNPLPKGEELFRAFFFPLSLWERARARVLTTAVNQPGILELSLSRRGAALDRPGGRSVEDMRL